MKYILLILIAATSLMAQVPNAPSSSRVIDKKFIITEVITMGFNLKDARSTQIGLSHGYTETSWMYGKHPSNMRLYGQSIGIESGFMLLDYLIKKKTQDKTDGKVVFFILPTLRMVGHGFAALANQGK